MSADEHDFSEERPFTQETLNALLLPFNVDEFAGVVDFEVIFVPR